MPQMGFMAFGYATEEFEVKSLQVLLSCGALTFKVTDARLGVYRPEEHIDNPKGPILLLPTSRSLTFHRLSKSRRARCSQVRF